ncbi:hypothetical protein MMC07_001541 [Pseudocyphellaria aurata]|nr:hypothetical protein [Pseudocyphellaria aurata]
MTTSLPPSIPDSQLGLSVSEIHLLRQHQQIALSPSIHQQQQAHAHSTASTRGRGHARTSASTSRATSAASSQPGNRLVLDPGSLALLGQHFDRLMGAIQNRVENVGAIQLLLVAFEPPPPLPGSTPFVLIFAHLRLTAQTQISTISQSARAGAAMAAADAEIARFRDILRQIDELEVEFDKVRHIRDIVKGFRSRVEGLERKVDGRGRR